MVILAVAWNEDASTLGDYASGQGLEWVFGEGPSSLARDYRVFQQSSKVGIGADGVIVLSEGYGRGGSSYWRGVLDRLREAGA